MDKQEFIRKYNVVKDNITNSMEIALNWAIENEFIDLEKCQGNYSDVYPLIVVVLQRELDAFTNGESEYVKRIRKLAEKYKKDYRIWEEYAGDYRGEKEEAFSCYLKKRVYEYD